MTSSEPWAPEDQELWTWAFVAMVGVALSNADPQRLVRLTTPGGGLSAVEARGMVTAATALALDDPSLMRQAQRWREHFARFGREGLELDAPEEIVERIRREVWEQFEACGRDGCEDRTWLLILSLALFTKLAVDAERLRIRAEVREELRREQEDE